MNIDIGAKFIFSVPLTHDHITALLELSASHYDAKCQAAGTKDGFIGRWNHTLELNQEFKLTDSTVLAEFRELDTCVKILELSDTLVPGEYLAAVREMRKSFRGALTLANSKHADWKVTYESGE